MAVDGVAGRAGQLGRTVVEPGRVLPRQPPISRVRGPLAPRRRGAALAEGEPPSFAEAWRMCWKIDSLRRIYRTLLDELHARGFPCLGPSLRLSKPRRLAIAASAFTRF